MREVPVSDLVGVAQKTLTELRDFRGHPFMQATPTATNRPQTLNFIPTGARNEDTGTLLHAILSVLSHPARTFLVITNMMPRLREKRALMVWCLEQPAFMQTTTQKSNLQHV